MPFKGLFNKHFSSFSLKNRKLPFANHKHQKVRVWLAMQKPQAPDGFKPPSLGQSPKHRELRAEGRGGSLGSSPRVPCWAPEDHKGSSSPRRDVPALCWDSSLESGPGIAQARHPEVTLRAPTLPRPPGSSPITAPAGTHPGWPLP